MLVRLHKQVLKTYKHSFRKKRGNILEKFNK